MAGKIKVMIDTLVKQRAQGNSVLEGVVKIKLILKGIDPKMYTPESDDDPAIIAKLEDLIKEFK
ncbi:MAG TPA: hypothetical protein VMJ66_03565 [Geobacteraceae bacterium]|nr:hypothetical protein [Geobacteraceae bacterium]